MTAKQGIVNRSFSFQKTYNNQPPRFQERLLQSLTQAMQSSLSPSKVMITAIRDNTSARTDKLQNLGVAIIMPFAVKNVGANKGGQFLLATLWEPSVLIGRSSSKGNQNDILILGIDGTVLSHTFTYMDADWAFPREIADFHSIKVGSMFRKWRDARDLHIAAISTIPEYNLRTLTIGSGAFIDQEIFKTGATCTALGPTSSLNNHVYGRFINSKSDSGFN